MTERELNDFFSKKNYDIRLSHFSRWIDQKCTPDVLWITADIILSYVDVSGNDSFNSRDIWDYGYTEENISDIFSKPDVHDPSASHEYDKFFSQPMSLLCYSGVLTDLGTGGRHKYIIENRDILEFIAMNDRCALQFLQSYIRKVLEDSDLYKWFNVFFIYQDSGTFDQLKNKFTEFYHLYTPVQGMFEPYRIFTKVLNPLSLKYGKLGTQHGHLSKEHITMSDLMYNQKNFRDIYSRKPKKISRQEWLKNLTYNQSEMRYIDRMMEREKKNLRLVQREFRKNISELTQYNFELFYDLDEATQIHHIFPKNEYPEIRHYAENLISITPNQHFLYAHPSNKTWVVDRDAQKSLLLAKTQSIRKNLESSDETTIYSFSNLLDVIQVGLDLSDDEVKNIPENDFDSLEHLINQYYQ